MLGLSAPFSIVDALGRGDAPLTLKLSPVVPQPCTGKADISFTLPAPTRMSLALYDAGGRKVRTLIDGNRGAGVHHATWRGDRDDGSPASAGMYFLRLDSDRRRLVQRLVWLR